MKWMTVKEYHELTGEKLSTIYKQVKENRIKFQKKFGKLIIGVTEKELA